MTIERSNGQELNRRPQHNGQKILDTGKTKRMPVDLSDYALDDSKKALELVKYLKELQAQGENVLLLETKKMNTADTNGQPDTGNIEHVQEAIPEIDELERRLASVPDEYVETKRAVIREWIRGLQGTGPLKPLDEEGQAKRRRPKEVEVDIVAARDWVTMLAKIFYCLDDQTTDPMTASTDYGIAYQVITRGIERGYVKQIGEEGRKTLIDAKSTAIVATIHRRFGGVGTRIVPSVMKEYFSNLDQK